MAACKRLFYSCGRGGTSPRLSSCQLCPCQQPRRAWMHSAILVCNVAIALPWARQQHINSTSCAQPGCVAWSLKPQRSEFTTCIPFAMATCMPDGLHGAYCPRPRMRTCSARPHRVGSAPGHAQRPAGAPEPGAPVHLQHHCIAAGGARGSAAYMRTCACKAASPSG